MTSNPRLAAADLPSMSSRSSALVTFALREEARPFRRLLGPHTDVQILETGVGQENARMALQSALASRRPCWVITSGYAGGLNPSLARGTIVFDADEGLPLVASLHAKGAVCARFHCADRIAATASEKRRLWETTRADAVEMESQVIRILCRERGIASATVRVISDAADEDLPLDFNRLLTPEHRVDYARLAGMLWRAPGRLGALIRFQKRVQAAASQLAQALVVLMAEGSAVPR